jgi:DNA anti-recombination protein RmuC
VIKRLSFAIVILYAFSACSNPKVKIVDRQRVLKDSITHLEQVVKQQNDSLTKDDRYKEMDIPEFSKSLAEIENNMGIIEQLKQEYDSLEFELKKY